MEKENNRYVMRNRLDWKQVVNGRDNQIISWFNLHDKPQDIREFLNVSSSELLILTLSNTFA